MSRSSWAAQEVPVADLMSLQKGATIPLNRRIGEPVDVIVNGRKIARGEITVLESDPFPASRCARHRNRQRPVGVTSPSGRKAG